MCAEEGGKKGWTGDDRSSLIRKPARIGEICRFRVRTRSSGAVRALHQFEATEVDRGTERCQCSEVNGNHRKITHKVMLMELEAAVETILIPTQGFMIQMKPFLLQHLIRGTITAPIT